MKIKTIALSILMSFFVSGCSITSLNPPDSFYKVQEARIAALTDLLSKPMVTVDCPAGQCKVEVYDPRAASYIPAAVEGTTVGKVAIAALEEGRRLLAFGAGAYAAVKIADKIGDRNYTVDADNGSSVAIGNTDISNSDSETGDMVGDTSGDVSGDISGDVTGDSFADSSTHDNPVDNSTHDNPIDSSVHDNPIDNSLHDNPVDSSDNSMHDNPVDSSDNSDNSAAQAAQ